jgi:NAD(P)-dependent dehydrogenase (short-subunit alcohol dehydrogenase family)
MPDLRQALNYDGRRVIVTGAASGIGAATTELLVGLGAEVHAADLHESPVPGVAQTHTFDLSDDDQVIDLVGEMGGDIDALFNCAGVPGTFDPQQILAVNFVGMRLLTETVIPRMPSGSAICCIGSTSGVSWQRHIALVTELLDTEDAATARRWGLENLARGGYPYDFSKEAVNAYVARRGVTAIGSGIRLNAINPGGTKTAATRDFTKVMKEKDGGIEMLQNYPRLLGRLANPVEQAWPMVFLNSGLASFVNGTSLFVDAGLTGGLFTEQYDPAVAKGMRWQSLSS